MRVHCFNDADISGQTTGVRVGENPTVATTPTRRFEHVDNDYYNNVFFFFFFFRLLFRSIDHSIRACGGGGRDEDHSRALPSVLSNVIMYRRCLAIDNAQTPSLRVRRTNVIRCPQEYDDAISTSARTRCRVRYAIKCVFFLLWRPTVRSRSPFVRALRTPREKPRSYIVFVVALETPHGIGGKRRLVCCEHSRNPVCSVVARGSFRDLKSFARSFARHRFYTLVRYLN